eukprot:1243764-Ditylum_brightwellii.AAC.1
MDAQLTRKDEELMRQMKQEESMERFGHLLDIIELRTIGTARFCGNWPLASIQEINIKDAIFNELFGQWMSLEH